MPIAVTSSQAARMPLEASTSARPSLSVGHNLARLMATINQARNRRAWRRSDGTRFILLDRRTAVSERELRDLIAAVKAGEVDRRSFVRTLGAFGLSAPFASLLLAQTGRAQALAPMEYKPTNAGGGGVLRTLFWQAPTLINPHFAVGTKDLEGSRIFYEPLAAWDGDGNLVPMLAAEIPNVEDGGIASDGLSVIWKLKRDVQWHDGRPFTADDVVFNWEYASDPATAATTLGTYRDVAVDKLDPHTVRVRFATPTPFWADAFVGHAA
jgi:peptide/nickel transport system substrate-binding protein